MRAFLNLRHSVGGRAEAFRSGLEALGYQVVDGLIFQPQNGDILVTWNRIHVGHHAALAFEAEGLPVLVVENATWGNGFLGRSWLTMARGQHNAAGKFPIGDSARWDSLGMDLHPWRLGGETVVLPQRGIGAVGAMPARWPMQMRDRGRVRNHPGQRQAMPLEQDLANAGRVVTWGSGAAVQALMWGIEVESHMPGWIAEQDNTDEGRLAMFRRLAWAQWEMHEIASGEVFERLLR